MQYKQYLPDWNIYKTTCDNPESINFYLRAFYKLLYCRNRFDDVSQGEKILYIIQTSYGV